MSVILFAIVAILLAAEYERARDNALRQPPRYSVSHPANIGKD
jgi:hypothetical protein